MKKRSVFVGVVVAAGLVGALLLNCQFCSALQEAEQLDASQLQIILDKGIEKYDLQDYKGAIAEFTKAIELDPNYAKAYYNRAVVKEELNDFSGAQKDFERAKALGYK